ncbi:MAG: hypothetical protein D6725_10655 [Planctomycetota bacterium]|nr:MAG: hypothetical protein D6725_10655 [Planctomycetota bacterium]
MSVSIIPCPKCGELLLSDTAQCPKCHHVLGRAGADPVDSGMHVETASSDGGSDEIPCPDCGEMVRKELVRCWQCGAFMRQEIAERYLQMQENPAPVIYSLPPDQGAEEQLLDRMMGDDSQAGTVDEDDFVLSESVAQAAQQAAETATPASPSTPPAQSDTAPGAAAPAAAGAAGGTADAEPSGGQSAGPAPAADATSGEASPRNVEDDDVPHSVKTGGDVLLNIALQEEQELQQRRKTMRKRGGRRRPFVPPNGFVIFCPNGHQIVVQERHRGMTGRCPRCKALFIVPRATWTDKPKPSEKAAEKTEPQPEGGRFDRWLRDVRLHIVDPTKLKLKEGALEKAFEPVDIGFAKDEMLLLRLAKPGLFGVPEKKRVEVREKVLQLLAEQVPVGDLPVEEAQAIDAEGVRTMAVVLPTPYPHESMFAGIPVFGKARIVVRIPSPNPEDATQLRFLSFTLSEFRRFARLLAARFGMDDFGVEMGVPLQDEFEELTCHYTDQKLQVLQHVDLYQADPAYELEAIGYRCGTCGLVVSEDGRKKEKIGGPAGKGLAKAKCPKCQGKFGVHPLYGPPKVTEAGEDIEGDPGEQVGTPRGDEASDAGSDGNASAETPRGGAAASAEDSEAAS